MDERASRFIWQEGDLELVSSPYWIDAEPRIVRAWAPFRPPFEPKPDSPAYLFRTQLRQAVSTLVVESEDEVLRWVYVSSARGLVDTENVLVYNLGPSYFPRINADRERDDLG